MSTKLLRNARWATVLVAIVAMAMSYHALARRAQESGIDWWLAWAYPLALDGLLVVGMLAATALRTRELRVRAYVWGVFAFGIVVSGLGNALPLDLPGALFRLVPPVSLALALHVFIVLSRRESAVRVRREQEPMAVRATNVRVLPSTAPEQPRSGSALARAVLASGEQIKAPELARRARISESRARAILAERSKGERLAVDSR